MGCGRNRRVTAAATAAGLVLLGSTGAQAAPRGSWQPQTLPAVFGNAMLQSSLALSGSDLWAVGQTGVSVGGAYEVRVVAMHFDGTSWTRANTPDRETAPANDYVFGVAGTATDDVWLVGGSNRPAGQGGRATLAEHWNGTQWQLLTSPDPSASDGFTAASSPQRGELWAVGDKADPNVGAFVPMVQRLSNGGWSEIPYVSPIAHCATKDTELTAVDALSSTDVYIGGDCVIRGHHHGVVAHWNGTQWSSSIVASINTTITGLGGGSGGNEVWAVGNTVAYGSTDTFRGIAYHGSGQTWAAAPMPVQQGTSRTIAGVGVGTGATPAVYAVGRTYRSAAAYQGLIYHWTGTHWANEAIASSNTELLYSAAVAPDGTAWAVGFHFGPNGDVCTALKRAIG
jgi:hypothetical protein